jgi:hypothetical protein
MAILIKNNLARIIGCAHKGQPVMLMPGITPVTQEQYDVLHGNPVLLAYFDRNELELLRPRQIMPPVEVEAKQGEPAPQATFCISSVPVREAASIITETFNVKLLREWLDKDERATVQRDIQRQLTRIDNGKE